MLSIGRESEVQPERLHEPREFPRLHEPEEVLQSPSLTAAGEVKIPAFEQKFLVSEAVAQQIEAWAEQKMDRDAFASLDRGGSYETTTLYLDTPGLDVFYRTSGFRGRKFRLRRYGEENLIYLERKSRRGDRVRKRRSNVPSGELSIFVFDGAQPNWSGLWFRDRIAAQSLQPVCRISYQRTAFMSATSTGPVRLTLDRNIRGVPTSAWELPPVTAGHGILSGHVVCEFKFRSALPTLFKELIGALQLQPGSISKYRRVMTMAGIANDGTGAHA